MFQNMKRVPATFERMLLRSALVEKMEQYRSIKDELQDLTQQLFPVGAKARVGENPSLAIVDHYEDEHPELMFVIFENGNVWPKRVELLQLVE